MSGTPSCFGRRASAIDAHVPWTRTVAEQQTLHGGRKVDLVPFILAHRDRLVLKPNDEYGGKGIVLGWDVDDGACSVRWVRRWPSRMSCRSGFRSERVIPEPGGWARHLRRPHLGHQPVRLSRAYVEGCLSRLSTAALVNVTAGGGSQVPTFLVEAR